MYYYFNRTEGGMDLQPVRPMLTDGSNYDYEFSSSSGYTHNTYHGPTKHYRPLLNSLTGSHLANLQPNEHRQPLRFTDSPQHHSSNAPNPSPRRKSSSTSNDGSEQLYAPFDRVGTIYIPGDYHGCQNEGSAHCLGCCIRPDAYRAETNLGFNYGAQVEHPVYTGYGSDYSGGSTLYGYSTDYAYDNPSSVSSGIRTPQRLPAAHMRTPSNVSSTSSNTASGSNVNPSFRLDDEGCIFSTPTHYIRKPDYDYGIGFSRQNSYESTNSNERPNTLETTGSTTKLRSSLKRNNYQTGSGGNTPTNPTPPDSLASDDSSYVSAKESNSSVSRVRFSPETLIDINVPTQNLDIQIRRTRQRPPTTTELDKEFLS